MNKTRTTVIALTLGTFVAACGGLAELTLGSGAIAPIQIDRSYDLTQPDMTQCPVGDQQIKDSRSGDSITVHVAQLADGSCQMAFEEPSLLLFSEADARKASSALQGQSLRGVQSASVTVTAYSLTDQSDKPVTLGGRISDLSLGLDGQVMVNKNDIAALDAGTPVKKTLSGPLLQKLVSGVNNHTAVHVSLTATVTVPSSALQNLPQQLHLQATLQPAVTVNVVQAATGG